MITHIEKWMQEMNDVHDLDMRIFQVILDNISDGAIVLSQDAVIEYANYVATKIADTEIVGQKIDDVFHGVDPNALGKLDNSPVSLKRDDTVSICLATTQLVESGSTTRYVITLRPIVSVASTGYQKFDPVFSLVLRRIGSTIWVWDLATKTFTFEDGQGTGIPYTLGYDTVVFGLNEIVHPDDAKYLTEWLRKYLREEIDLIDKDIRLKNKDGTWHWVRCVTLSPVIDLKARPSSVVGLMIDIDEHKQFELDYESIKSQYDWIVSTVPSLILVTDEELNIVSCNDSALRTFECTEEELVGINYFELVHGSGPDLATRQQLLRKLTRKHVIQDVEAYLSKPDGTLFPARITYVLLSEHDGRPERVLINITDISDNKLIKALQADTDNLQAERDKMMMYFDFAHVLLLILDTDGKIALINQRGAEMLGRPKEELIGQSFFDYIPSKNRHIVIERFNLLITGKMKQVDDVVRPIMSATGEIHDIRWKTRVLRSNGNIVGLVSTGEDITEQIHTEKLLKRERAAFRLVAEAAIEEADLKSIMYRILEGLVDCLGFDSGVFGAYDPDANVIRPTVLSLIHEPSNFRVLPMTEEVASTTISGHACFYNKPIYCSDISKASKYQGFKADIERFNIRGVVSIPIVGGNKKLYGVLTMFSSKPMPWIDENYLFFNTLSNMLVAVFERWQSLDALRYSEQRYRDIILNIPEGIWITDLENRFVLVNQSFAKMLGYLPEEIMGRSVFEFIEQGEINKINIETEKRKSGVISKYYLLMKHRDGRSRIIQVSALPLHGPDGSVQETIAVLLDVTEQVKAEEALKTSETKWRTLVQTVPNIILTMDLDGRVTFANQPIFDIPIERIVGRRFSDVLPEDVAAPIMDIIEGVRATKTTMVFRNAVPDPKTNSERWFQSYATPILDGDEVTDILFVSSDITDIKRNEDEIRRLNEDLSRLVKARTAELEAANKELEAFVYSVSHDLRSPLRSITGFSQALMDDYYGRLDDTGRDFLARILRAANRMARLIDDLLKLSRISRRALSFSTVNLSDVAKEIVAELRSQSPTRKVNVKIHDHIVAWCDERAIRIVLENLLSNAWKFTSTVKKPRIEFKTEIIGDEKVFIVSDNGAGFDMRFADKLFQPFQRLHRNDEFEGYGVGLATVKRLIDKHGGKIWAEAEVGKGATFYFTLPVGVNVDGTNEDNPAS